ncbi:MAG: glycosyl hydrolase family 8 [Candidatus Omnitrophica bacterium]|nr:glycosyl hydrolase family 8 [Candidatus Omnitrophota bacterium]
MNGGQDGPRGIIRYEQLTGADANGYNAASDDIEIAAALYFAYRRGWGDGDQYLTEARLILQDAWDKYVFQVGEQYYFFAGDQFSWSGVINPSYFRPAFFSRVFPAIDTDPRHPWQLLSGTSYEVLEQSGQLTFDDIDGRSMRGVNLPPNWVALDYRGRLSESRAFFPDEAGEIFGWDAFRSLYAVAQDYAWFGNTEAGRYLTDPAVGPIDFLTRQLRGGRMPSGFHHNGSPVQPDPDIEQTHDLNGEQLAMYGGYLPFFHYAGSAAAREAILSRLQSSFHTYEHQNPDGTEEVRGFWGDNRTDYYNQNWVWFGLFLTNTRPEDNAIVSIIRSLTAPAEPAIAGPNMVFTENDLYPFRVDPELGTRAGDRRPKLNRELVRQNCSLAQLRDTITATFENQYSPLGEPLLRDAQFQQVFLIDQQEQNQHNLLPFLADRREYWNNIITLLSVYIQKLIEENNTAELADALMICQYVSAHVASAEPEVAPHTYNRVVLLLVEAELRAQTTDQDISFYEEGIFQAVDGIYAILGVDPDLARPDFYLVSKALMTMGDLYLRMHEATRQLDQPVDYLARAAQYYSYVANLSYGVSIDDSGEGLYLAFDWNDVTQALRFNRGRGYLSADEETEALTAMSQLQLIALIKNAALVTQRPGARDIAELLHYLRACNYAIDELELSGESNSGFFASFARIVKADLLLALADTVKYQLWPYSPDAVAAAELRPEIQQIRDQLYSLFAEDSYADEDYLYIIDALDCMLFYLGSASPNYESLTDTMFSFNHELLDQADNLYRSIPSELSYLYVWAQTKRTEIGVRTAHFIDREFRYIVPFYTDQVLVDNPLPANDFLGIEQTYLRALLLASSDNTGEALVLLSSVLSNSGQLDPNFQTYFQVHALLRIGEIVAQDEQSLPEVIRLLSSNASTRELVHDWPGTISHTDAAINIFTEIEKLITDLGEANLSEMAWRPYSLEAELYQEWANLLGDNEQGRAKAAEALEMCYRSDSQYDLDTRRDFILLAFNNHRSLTDRDTVLQETYGRRPRNGY